jgi:UDP-N-acetylmuramoylalanine--D-glutamate ligase
VNTRASKGLNIAVLGAGESGVSAARLLASEGARVTVFDSAPEDALKAKQVALADAGIELRGGDAANRLDEVFSWGVLSPGIDPGTQLVKQFVKAGIPLVGELELAFQRCAAPIVAITGTNGKTTTTQLVETIFNAAGVSTVACGNISPAFSAKVGESQSLAVMTVEVSSFQLENIHGFAPKIAVWLNFTADHLDRYSSMQEYFQAKLRIFENQQSADWAVVNLRDNLPPLKARKITFSAFESGADFSLRNNVIHFHDLALLPLEKTQLRGSHNAENIMAALGVGHAWGLQWDSMIKAIAGYTPLPHRCELVGTIDGIDFVNDSKATNIDALEKALSSESRRVILIAGGKDKGFEFGSVTDLVAQKCASVLLIGEMAERIKQLWGHAVDCHYCESLGDAVYFARSLASPGDVVLFSPGTSSFDMFKNYADRGNQFRSIVQGMSLRASENSQPARI